MIAKAHTSLTMKSFVSKSTWLLIFVFVTIFSSLKAQDSAKVLWYSAPTEEWMQALPIGNGRLGAMVFGGPFKEHLQLNEDSMWAGGSDWEDAQGTPENLEELRQLLREGKTMEVDMSWKNGTLEEVVFRSPSDTSIAVKYGSPIVDLQLKANEEVKLNARLKKRTIK